MRAETPSCPPAKPERFVPRLVAPPRDRVDHADIPLFQIQIHLPPPDLPKSGGSRRMSRKRPYFLAITTSRYSLGTTMVVSPDRFMRTIRAYRSLWRSCREAASSAAKAFS